MWLINSLLVGLVFSRAATVGATVISTVLRNSIHYRFDTDGSALDLTSGKIDKLGGTYIWYGLPFGCGLPFCGVTTYSSPDLQTWQFNGLLFDPTTPDIQKLCLSPGSGNCGRPHIVYSEETKKYVLWVNSGMPGYVVFTSTSPTSGFVRNPNRALVGVQPPGPFQAGDFSVQVINGTGYLTYSLIDFTTAGASIWPPFLQTLYIQKLTTDMINTTGTATEVSSAAKDLLDLEAESPDIFKRGDYFYITASNTCGFCNGTVLLVYRSTNTTGPWERQIISGDTCGGQTTGVLTLDDPSGGPTSYLHTADLFNSAPLSGIRTGSHGHQIQALTFNDDGSVQDLDCSSSKSVGVTFEAGINTTLPGRALEAVDSSGQNDIFYPVCDFPQNSVYQTWASSRTGTLSEVGVNLAGPKPSGNTTITLFRFQNNTNFFTPHFMWETLTTANITRDQIGESFQVVRIASNAAVQTGDKLGIAISTGSTVPLCRLAKMSNHVLYDLDTSTRTLFANGAGQVSMRGKDGTQSPVAILPGEEIKWYAIIAL